MSLIEPPDLFGSTLRIFLSVDIVGSTAFKQMSSTRGSEKMHSGLTPAEPWFSPIAQFYRGMERSLAREWKACVEKMQAIEWPTGPAPELWKSVGDELIYTKVLSDFRETLSVLHAWKNAVSSYRAILREQFPALDLKSTAWIAGFPVNNSEIIFRSNVSRSQPFEDDDDPFFSNLLLLNEYRKNSEDPSLTRDFIGPAIDTGFRLSQFSTARKMVISIDLALLLVNAKRVQPHDFTYDSFSFYYDGRQSLKGVFGGIPYPLLWIDMKADEALEVSEDKIDKRDEINTDDMKAFCEAFISSNSRYIIIPYIIGDQGGYFGRMPPSHIERIDKIKAYWQAELQKRQDEETSALQSDETEVDHAASEPSAATLMDELAKLIDTMRSMSKGANEKEAE